MELQVLVSKKGTKVVTATDLYLALELPNKQYAANVKRWLHDVYGFRGGIRRPEGMKDFAKRPTQDKLIDDYYLSVELAKLITLNSRSKAKMKFANFLCKFEDPIENGAMLTTEQVLAVMELAKVMGLVSCQAASEQKHLETYEQRNGGSAANWWNFRSEVLGYSTDELKETLQRLGKNANGKSRRQLLMHLDKHEMVRTAVIDLFMALGKSEQYAKTLGDLAKVFARELNVEIFDDRDAPAAFAPQLNTELADEVKYLRKGKYLQLWEPQRMAS